MVEAIKNHISREAGAVFCVCLSLGLTNRACKRSHPRRAATTAHVPLLCLQVAADKEPFSSRGGEAPGPSTTV